MTATPKTKPRLKNLDELFQLNDNVNPLESQEPIQGETKRDKIIEVAISELHAFENHPFKVLDDDAMNELVESIRENGLLHPGIARPRKNGGYELIAGHRRKHACELAGMTKMKIILRELNDDDAILVMVDSNLQRETLLFSEKAFAYKIITTRLAGGLRNPPL